MVEHRSSNLLETRIRHVFLLDLEFMDEVLPENSDYKESRNTG